MWVQIVCTPIYLCRQATSQHLYNIWWLSQDDGSWNIYYYSWERYVLRRLRRRRRRRVGTLRRPRRRRVRILQKQKTPIFIHVKWLIDLCDTIQCCFCCCVPSRAWHDTFTCGHNSFMCATWLIHMCKTTHLSHQYDLKVCGSHCFLLSLREITL